MNYRRDRTQSFCIWFNLREPGGIFVSVLAVMGDIPKFGGVMHYCGTFQVPLVHSAVQQCCGSITWFLKELPTQQYSCSTKKIAVRYQKHLFIIKGC